MRLNWSAMKTFLDNTGLYYNLNYVEIGDSYYAWIKYEGQILETAIDFGSNDYAEFQIYKEKTVLKKTISEDGLYRNEVFNLSRNKYLQELSIYFKPSSNEGALPLHMTLKRYDAEDNEVTPDLSVKSVLIFEPPYSYDICGGIIEVLEYSDYADIKDLLVAVIGNPDIPRELGGDVPVVKNRKLNKNGMILVDTPIFMPLKYVEGQRYNIIKVAISYPLGFNNEMQVTLKTFAY